MPTSQISEARDLSVATVSRCGDDGDVGNFGIERVKKQKPIRLGADAGPRSGSSDFESLAVEPLSVGSAVWRRMLRRRCL